MYGSILILDYGGDIQTTRFSWLATSNLLLKTLAYVVHRMNCTTV